MYKCEGECKNNSTCKGSVKLVLVTENYGTEWGVFAYCDTAIEEDKKRGFVVKIITDLGQSF